MTYNNFNKSASIMQAQQMQKIALDSCVVIDLIDKRIAGNKIRAKLNGKSVILCDKVIQEVHKVRGIRPERIIELITKYLGRKPEMINSTANDVIKAQELSENYFHCHKGDNLILAVCMAHDFVLLTFDRMFLQVCDMIGVIAFHPIKDGRI